jgi:hypothetical protein
MLTANEVAFSRAHASQYVLVRAYDYDKTGPSGKYFALEGEITEHFHLEPTEFRARLK